MKKLSKLFLILFVLILTVSVMTSCDVDSLKDNIMGVIPGLGASVDSLKDNIMGVIPGLGASCEHSWSEATCELPSTCDKCGATEGSALGHIEKTVTGYEADCTTDGLTDGLVCDVCGEVLLEQEVITSLGHTLGTAATCTEDQVCTECGEVLVAAHHVPGAEATCTEDQKCTVCSETLVAAHHVPGAEATCTEDQKCTVCSETLVAAYHVPGAEATCTEDQKCTVCSETLVAAHHTPGASATCTTDQTCTVCGEVIVEKHHTPGTPATCKSNQICTSCRVVLVSMHPNRTILEGYAATCTEDGLTYGERCNGCNTILTKQTVITALGHNFENGYCTACGQEYYSVGMVFELSYNGEYYIAKSIGKVQDKDIVIPSKYKGLPVEIIGGDFTRYSSYKTNFETIKIPTSIREIQTTSGYSYGPFYGCVNLKKVYIESVESWFNVRVYYTSNREGCNPMHYGAELYAGGELVTEVAIPKSMTELEYDYFYGCSSITNIVFHDSLYVLAGFSGLPNLTEVNIPSCVKVIKGNALANCQNLSVITIPDKTYHIFTQFSGTAYYNNPDNWDEGKVLYIGNHLIKVKTDISGEYTVKAGTNSISPYAFESCRNLTKLNLNSELLVIGSSAFSGNTSLKSLIIPSNVRYIGDNALSGVGGYNKNDVEIVFEYKGAWYQHGNLYTNLSSSSYIYGSRGSAYVTLYLNNNKIAGTGTGYGGPHISDYTLSYGICR